MIKILGTRLGKKINFYTFLSLFDFTNDTKIVFFWDREKNNFEKNKINDVTMRHLVSVSYHEKKFKKTDDGNDLKSIQKSHERKKIVAEFVKVEIDNKIKQV